ncbi:MAG: YitT family protein [Candidatus Izemoplasmatales bacterium]|jgi:uncharacterized membrane-anchored protein YitT (DUF2179 family)|nr:YitT family protein [bacterium]MDZ4196599.1 YitT family protein [Candidatus Izemoplasmatales bacterium]
MISLWNKEKKTIIHVFLGSLLIGAGIAFFINAQRLYVGGINGLTQLIVNLVEFITDGNVVINLGIFAFILQVPLMVFGYFKLSKKFILYTTLSVFIISLFLAIPFSVSLFAQDKVAATLIGGILIGFGNGLLLKVGASSGGISILSQYLNIKTGKTVGTYQLLFNGMIISVAGIIFGIEIALYTIISHILTSLVIDKVHTGYNFMEVQIISSKGNEIADELRLKMVHGVTVVDAIGWYSKQPKKMIYTVISVHEMDTYIKLIESIDPSAFVIMDGVTKIHGKFIKKIIQ